MRIFNALCKGGVDSLNHLVLLVGIPLADLALNSVQGDLPPLLCQSAGPGLYREEPKHRYMEMQMREFSRSSPKGTWSAPGAPLCGQQLHCGVSSDHGHEIKSWKGTRCKMPVSLSELSEDSSALYSLSILSISVPREQEGSSVELKHLIPLIDFLLRSFCYTAVAALCYLYISCFSNMKIC